VSSVKFYWSKLCAYGACQSWRTFRRGVKICRILVNCRKEVLYMYKLMHSTVRYRFLLLYQQSVGVSLLVLTRRPTVMLYTTHTLAHYFLRFCSLTIVPCSVLVTFPTVTLVWELRYVSCCRTKYSTTHFAFVFCLYTLHRVTRRYSIKSGFS